MGCCGAGSEGGPRGGLALDRSEVSKYELLPGVAYGTTALFALSAIYGWVVEAQCATLRREVAGDEPKIAVASAKQAPFPRSVLEFDFRYRPAQAAQLCSARGATWSFEQNVGLCRWPGRTTKPSVQVAFELGVPSHISVIYEAADAQLPTVYAALAASMRKYYGQPQVDAASPSATCATTLASCLRMANTSSVRFGAGHAARSNSTRSGKPTAR